MVVSRETGNSAPTIRRYNSLLKLAPSIQQLLTTSDEPAGICTPFKLAEIFPYFDYQEYALELVCRFKKKIQLEILKQSDGVSLK